MMSAGELIFATEVGHPNSPVKDPNQAVHLTE